MKWTESIHLRSGKDIVRKLLSKIPELTKGLSARQGFKDIGVLTDAIFDSDIIITISWSKNEAPAKSLEGLSISEYMKQFGVVNHSLWLQHPCNCLIEERPENS